MKLIRIATWALLVGMAMVIYLVCPSDELGDRLTDPFINAANKLISRVG